MRRGRQSLPERRLCHGAAPNGTILSHSDASRIGSSLPSQGTRPGTASGRIRDASSCGRRISRRRTLVNAADGTQVASVVGEFLAALHRRKPQPHLRFSMLIIGSGIAILGLLILTLMLNHFIMRPIKGLMKVVRHLRANPGDYSRRVETPGRQDEIGADDWRFQPVAGERTSIAKPN